MGRSPPWRTRVKLHKQPAGAGLRRRVFTPAAGSGTDTGSGEFSSRVTAEKLPWTHSQPPFPLVQFLEDSVSSLISWYNLPSSGKFNLCPVAGACLKITRDSWKRITGT